MRTGLKIRGLIGTIRSAIAGLNWAADLKSRYCFCITWRVEVFWVPVGGLRGFLGQFCLGDCLGDCVEKVFGEVAEWSIARLC